MTLIILFLKNYKKKKDHFKNPVSLPIQSEAFGWLLAWSEPRNAIFYDFRIGESWPDVFLKRFDKQKHWMVHINLKILKKKSLFPEACCRPMDISRIPNDAAQPPIAMVVMIMLEIHPVGWVGRLAGPLCKMGRWAKGVSPVDFETIWIDSLDVFCDCNIMFCPPSDSCLRRWRILRLW